MDAAGLGVVTGESISFRLVLFCCGTSSSTSCVFFFISCDGVPEVVPVQQSTVVSTFTYIYYLKTAFSLLFASEIRLLDMNMLLKMLFIKGWILQVFSNQSDSVILFIYTLISSYNLYFFCNIVQMAPFVLWHSEYYKYA